MQRLQRADQFPPFTLRQVALRSEGFISIVLANVSTGVELTISGEPGEDVAGLVSRRP